MPGPTTCPYRWVVIADQWVDDLESERDERYRGFESLRFRRSAHVSTILGLRGGFVDGNG